MDLRVLRAADGAVHVRQIDQRKQRDPFQMQSLCRKAENKELQLRLDRWTWELQRRTNDFLPVRNTSKAPPQPGRFEFDPLAAVNGERR